MSTNGTDPAQQALVESAFREGYANQAAQMSAGMAHPGVGLNAQTAAPVRQPEPQPEQTYGDAGAVSYGRFK